MTRRDEDIAYNQRPQPPRPPEPGECCQSGCEPCVYDRYWDALAEYEKALEQWEVWRKSHESSCSFDKGDAASAK
jgi:hypothetical protein